MMSTFTPPVPAQRKVKLTSALKTTLSEQSTKLQSKHEVEQDLLEDIKNYAKHRAALEKDYAQGMLKITTQMLGKMQSKDDSMEEQLRTPCGLWRKILEETEAMANLRLKISQTLLSDVVESIKNLKSERVVTSKKCATLAEHLQEEIIVSATDLVKGQKTYTELQKLTIQATQNASSAQEKLKRGNVSIFSSKAKLERNVSKCSDRMGASEKRSTISRNDYLLTLAAINAHQRKYYSRDLPDLIAVQDGEIYENLKSYYTTITDIEREACKVCVKNLDDLEGPINALERAYVSMCFLKENPIFTKCEPYEYIAVTGDSVTTISDQYGAGLTLNKEARKWALRLAREHKNIRKKTKELRELKQSAGVANTQGGCNETPSTENTKSLEETVDVLTEEIRHIEVLRTKAEGRVEALNQAGVNVDEWLQGAISEQDEDENDLMNNNEYIEEDEFVEDEWDDASANYNDNYSDDSHSVSSSLDPKIHSKHAIALYAFDANSQEELSINVGEELELLEMEGDGWCRTRNKLGEVGFVPETYIEIAKNTSLSEDSDSVSKASSRASSLMEGTTSLISEINIDSVHSLTHSSIISLDSNPETPTPTPGYDETITPTPGMQTPVYRFEITTPAPEFDTQTPKFICFAKAIYDYDAVEDEELTFHAGDVITVMSKMVDDDDGWWEGIVNGKRGVFPSLVVEETKPSDPALGCQDDYNLPHDLADDSITRSRTLGYYDAKNLVNR